jgi:hypothetical protein
MNIRPLLLLAGLASTTLLSACGEVDHNAGATHPLPKAEVTTTTTIFTIPSPDLNGQICWTEVNKDLPEGVEGICGDEARLDQQLDRKVFLHWGMPKVADYRVSPK